MMQQPYINILIRTSNRPKLFQRCLASVYRQSYPNLLIKVGVDNDKAEQYVKNALTHNLDFHVRYRREVKQHDKDWPYNLYCNHLLARVLDGWFMFLDDDDYLADPFVMERLVQHLTDPNKLYITRMKWPNGRVIPSEKNFLTRQVVRKDIGMPCFIMHAKQIRKVKFKRVKQGDYHMISALSRRIKSEWIDEVVAIIGNTGGSGKTEKEL